MLINKIKRKNSKKKFFEAQSRILCDSSAVGSSATGVRIIFYFWILEWNSIRNYLELLFGFDFLNFSSTNLKSSFSVFRVIKVLLSEIEVFYTNSKSWGIFVIKVWVKRMTNFKDWAKTISRRICRPLKIPLFCGFDITLFWHHTSYKD